MTQEILDNRELYTIANTYGFFPADFLYENRITDKEGVNWCSLSARDRSTGVLVKYDADELDYPD